MLLALALLVILGLAAPASIAQSPPMPPDQPETGPGGMQRPFASVIVSRHGEEPTGYWLFEPAGADGRPADHAQPLVLFFHGFTALDPQGYRAWIDHIVRRGAVVIYPDYQTRNLLQSRPAEYLANARQGIADALAELERPGHVPVDLDRVAAAGHSAGGVLAVNYAASVEQGLPAVSALFPVEPGGCRDCGNVLLDFFGIPLEDLSQLDPGSRAIVVVGEDDGIVGTAPGEAIWNAMSSLYPGHRDLVVLRGDDYGEPALAADHFLPMTGDGGTLDALDWYGPWKLFDALLLCTFEQFECDSAMGGSSEQQSMGQWSDGTPVRPAIVQSQ